MRSTNKAIAALKATYQTPVYPLLDQVRSGLCAKIDQELAHLKVTPHLNRHVTLAHVTHVSLQLRLAQYNIVALTAAHCFRSHAQTI